MTTKLPGAKLNLHEVLWSVPWDDVISERDGESKRLLEVMKEMSQVMKSCQNWDATPGAMAWLLLWSRNFGIAQSALALLECRLLFTGGGQLRMLEVLWRQAMELQLDLMVIANPTESSFGNTDPKKSVEVYDRLCAYLAFCANNESRHYIKLAQKYALDALDSQQRFEKEYLGITSQYSGSLKELLQVLWGDDVENDGATHLPSRAKKREFAFGQKNRLRRWLEHRDLAKWDDELRKRFDQKRYVMNFPDLVTCESVRNMLRNYEMEFGYLSYQQASATIHGSHIGPFMEDIGSGFIPSVFKSDDDLEREAAHVRRFTHNNAFRLHRLQEGIVEFCVAG